MPAHHALLHVPRIRTDLQHIQVVVRFKNQTMATLHALLDDFRNISEISDQANSDALGIKREGNWIHRIVRDRERRDLNVADAELLTGSEVFEALNPGVPAHGVACG